MLICFCKDTTHTYSIPKILMNDVGIERLYSRYYANQLKRAGKAQHDLVRVYVSAIRSVLEHACPVWHTCLTYLPHSEQRNGPKGVLKCVYLGQSAILRQTKLLTLHERIDELYCWSYFTRMKREDQKLNHLLPAARDQPYPHRHDRPCPSIKGPP